MRIAMIAPENLPVPPALGGAIPQTLYETMQAIDQPDLCTIAPWHPAVKTYGKPEGEFHHIDIQKEQQKISQTLLAHNLEVRGHTSETHQFYYLNGVTDVLQKIAPDLIQIHNRPQYASYFRKQFPNIPIILYMHNEPSEFNSNLRENIENCDHIVFVSQFLKGLFCRVIPNITSKSICIYNSVNTQYWHPSLKDTQEVARLHRQYHLDPDNTILFSGRLVYKKGLTFLLDAMKQIRQKIPQAKLLIVGSPFFKSVQHSSFLSHLKNKAQTMPDTIHFTGYIDHAQLPYYYASSALTIVPSLYREAFCKVASESMAMGIPVIGSNRGALPELIDHNTNGYLIDDPRNTHHLTEQIIALLQDKDLRQEFGKNARKKMVEQFDTSKRIKSLCSFYQGLQKTQPHKRSPRNAA